MQIPHIYQACHGRADLLLAPFFSPWLNEYYQGTLLFYRPLVPLSLALDCALSGGNPVWFHISNLFFQIACSIILFFCGRDLFSTFGKEKAVVMAFAAGALFAACPLHLEVVNFIGARFDSLCTLFCLLSFLLFRRSRQTGRLLAKVLSLCAFSAGLLCKEMAATLPAVLALDAFIFYSSKQPLSGRIKQTLVSTCPFWLAAGLYFIARASVTGSAFGGYTGSLGAYFSQGAFERFAHLQWLYKILYPFDSSIIPDGSPLVAVFQGFYLACAILVCFRLRQGSASSPLSPVLLFLLCWIVLLLLPVWQFLDLGQHLCGARHFYFMSAPLSLLIAALIFSSSRPAIGSILLSVFVLGSGFATWLNNEAWLAAASRLQALERQLALQVRELPAATRAVLVNLPLDFGAGMSLTFPSVQGMLKPPFQKEDLSARVDAPDRRLFVAPSVINVSRLREMGRKPCDYAFFVFDSQSLKLRRIQPEFRQAHLGLTAARSYPNEDGQLAAVDFSGSPPECLPLSAEELIVTAACQRVGPCPAGRQPAIFVQWTTSESPAFQASTTKVIPVKDDGLPHQYRLNLSQYSDWVLAGRIGAIRLMFPGVSYKNQLLSISLGERSHLVPAFCAAGAVFADGAGGVLSAGGGSLDFVWDASAVPGAKAVAVEIGKPYCSLQLHASTYRLQAPQSELLSGFILSGSKGHLTLPVSMFPEAACYQIRVGALSAGGTSAGGFCDPLTVRVSREQLARFRRAP